MAERPRCATLRPVKEGLAVTSLAGRVAGRAAPYLGGATFALALGCSDPAASMPAAPSFAAPTSSAPSGPTPRTPTPGCRAPAGVSNAPHTIDETVTLVNALPKPLSLPCFLESLARPLQINATDSLFSAQPAQGPRSPRIFLFQGLTTMSIVVAGPGAPLLEFGEQRPNLRSLKAEITFPVEQAITPSTPFENLMLNEQLTTCAVCHASETEESAISGIRRFVSQSLRPLPRDEISAQTLQHELEICDRTAEAARCALLDGLLGWGSVADHDFPVEMATFGGNQ